MTVTVQQSLFAANDGTTMVKSAHWIESLMLGDIALGLCVIAVAFVGALLLAGQSPLREGARTLVGCFVLLAAPTIAAGFAGSDSVFLSRSTFSGPMEVLVQNVRPALRPLGSDTKAGASLRED